MSGEPTPSEQETLSPAAIHDFKARLRGELLGPQDDGYEAARKIWNGMIDRHPALIARCASAADVIAAVKFARAHALLVSVRGGGHNAAGNAVCEGGLMIDLSRMKSLRIDPVRRTARAEPGLTWGEFDHDTQAVGLALTGGIQSTTGIAGFTLGGGFGYLARKHGLTCDNLLSADVVTAEGEFLTASPSENADLFWGLRGGGGNFGIVTSFEFQLHPLGPILGGRLFYPAARAREVLSFYREFVAAAPDELFTVPMFVTAPRAAILPDSLQGMPVLAVALCYSGAIPEGERLLQPLRSFGPPAADLVKEMPYTAVQQMLDPANPPGFQNYWKAEYLSALSDAALDTLVDRAARIESPMSKVLLPKMQGAIARVGPDDTAYAFRDAPFLLNLNAMWAERGESDRHIAWARDTWTAMQPFSAGGVYVNFLSDEGEARVRAAYPPRTYARLVALKNKYDPTNFFRLNQNIRPTT